MTNSKVILFTTMLFLILVGASQCSTSCTPTIAACNDVVPSNELCAAYFSRWFYNKNKGVCELKNYSGCSQKGFATQQECNLCKCK
jgi:hypothetical protein